LYTQRKPAYASVADLDMEIVRLQPLIDIRARLTLTISPLSRRIWPSLPGLRMVV
jgi:hypothetical protein